MRKRTLLQIGLEVTPELFEVIDHAKGTRSRGPVIEELLWESPGIQRSARALQIERKPRNGRGRPRKTEKASVDNQ